MNAPALIPVSTAQLPRTYEAAKRALSECSEVDECKDWADKAAALASYARQAEDDQLERMAQRIRARATRRAGELLKQIEPGKTGPKPELSMGDHTQFTREDAAREAGMSKHQQVQAVRIASIPEDDFEAQVESPKPPTLTQLASQGIQRREPPPKPEQWLQGRDPKMFNRALHFTALVTEYAADLAKSGAVEILPHLDDGQRMKLR
ncbi:MAG: hypothetical protein KA139_07660, partial [Rhodobacteraceae bacterium]|nr:hypothetical protein [Paracoccaceae bacterium]